MTPKPVTLADVSAAVTRLREGNPTEDDARLVLAWTLANWRAIEAFYAGSDDPPACRCSWCGREVGEVRVCKRCGEAC